MAGGGCTTVSYATTCLINQTPVEVAAADGIEAANLLKLQELRPLRKESMDEQL